MAKILLIEDDLTYSKIIKNFLEKNGYEVTSSTKVTEGLQSLERMNPDLVITDYRLPDGTGMEVLDQVTHYSSVTPVILITNYSDIRTAVKSMKMGAFEYITKPINPDELLLTVKQALKKDPQKQALTQQKNHPLPGKNQLICPTKSVKVCRRNRLKNTLN